MTTQARKNSASQLTEYPEHAHILMVGEQTAATFTPLTAYLHLPTRISTTNSGQEALNLLGRLPIDVLIVDEFLPDMIGSQLIQTLRQQGQNNIYTILLIPDDVYGRVLALNSRFTIDIYLNPNKNPILNLPLMRQALNGRSLTSFSKQNL